MSNIQYQISNIKYPTNNKIYDIHERIFRFIIDVLNFLNKIPFSYSNQVYKNQITRSVTSMGANDQEADGALTDKDFIHCFTIVRKEGKESVYWLRLIQATSPNLSLASSLITEGLEIVAVVSTIIKNAAITSKKKIKK